MHASKLSKNDSYSAIRSFSPSGKKAQAAPLYRDNRPEAIAQRKLIDLVNAYRQPGKSPAIVQRVKITGSIEDYDVDSETLMDALHKKFVETGNMDIPLFPNISSHSNEGTINRPPGEELGRPWELSNNPLVDFWQIAMHFKKSRTEGAINIMHSGKSFASATYNQYGKTAKKHENDDVMIYKAPGEGIEKKDSDKGVSYKLAATKFKEIAEQTKLKDTEIAQAILEFYKNGKMPDEIGKDEKTKQNFGYLTTLMTVPETKRDIGTFPLGLIMLDNIANGKTTSAKAFTSSLPAKEITNRNKLRKQNDEISKKNEKLKKGEIATPLLDVPPKYKDKIDEGGEYAPAYTGSKKYLNAMESTNLEGKSIKSSPNDSTKQEYYWNTTIKRYAKMVETFLEAHPELCNVSSYPTTKKEDAINEVINQVLTHFGIGDEILKAKTPSKSLLREDNTALDSIWNVIKPGTYGNQTSIGELIDPGKQISVSVFEMGSNVEEKGDSENMEFTKDFFSSTKEMITNYSDSINEYPIAPSSPTRNAPKKYKENSEKLTGYRKKRKFEEEDKNTDPEVNNYLRNMQEQVYTQHETQVNHLTHHEYMAEKMKQSKKLKIEEKEPSKDSSPQVPLKLNLSFFKQQQVVNTLDSLIFGSIEAIASIAQRMGLEAAIIGFLQSPTVTPTIEQAVKENVWEKQALEEKIREKINAYFS